jgi:hypothetical protein
MEEDDAVSAAESIRELQRRKRETARHRGGFEAILARPDPAEDADEEEEDEAEADEGASPAPLPPRVFVVFQGAKWTDPDGILRESDHIAGVFATEDAARRAVMSMNKDTEHTGERDDPWYQPYPVDA